MENRLELQFFSALEVTKIVVNQFPSGVVPSAEMAGFTPCMGIYWSEIFLQGACPCLPPTSVF